MAGSRPGNPNWVKGGKSPNPGGRAKLAEEFRARARTAVDEHVLDAWIAEVECQGKEWVKCSELLAAYGYGKPTQPLSGGGEGGEASAAVIVHLVKPDADNKG